jgi:hypothetical protein
MGRSTGFGQTTLDGLVLKSTDAAILWQPAEGGEEFWIPRKVCLDGDALEDGDEDIAVADWWLDQEGKAR